MYTVRREKSVKVKKRRSPQIRKVLLVKLRYGLQVDAKMLREYVALDFFITRQRISRSLFVDVRIAVVDFSDLKPPLK